MFSDIMEKVLIVFGHPGPKRHNHLILDNVINDVKKKGLDFEVIDLYKIKYDPVLKGDELYTHGNRDISVQNKIFQKKIKDAKCLVFIFPVWWNNMPAIMKGFIDRVFTARFAFTYKKIFLGFKAPIGLLKGKKAAVFITSGSPKWIFSLVLGNRASKVIAKDTLRFCGIRARVFHHGNAEKPITDKTKKKISDLVKKGLNWLLK